MPEMIQKDFVVCTAVLDRLEMCPASGVYVCETQEKPTFSQWYGIFIHRFLEYAKTRGREAALNYIAEKFPSLIRTVNLIDVDSIPDGDVEVALAHNPYSQRARRLGRRIRADVQSEVFGKADLIVESGPRPHVIDYKCGPVSDDPAQHPQLLGLAVSVRDESRNPNSVEAVDVSLVGVHSNGHLEWVTKTIHKPELDAFTARVRSVHLRVIDDRERARQGIKPEFVRAPTADDWRCGWCSCRPVCPAWR